MLWLFNARKLNGSRLKVREKEKERAKWNDSRASLLYSAYILWVFNFANLESFVKYIQLKFEPLRCHTHGKLKFAKLFQRIPLKQLFVKI